MTVVKVFLYMLNNKKTCGRKWLFPEYVNQNGQQYAQYYTGHNREINFIVLPFKPYVTRQTEQRQNIGKQSQNNQKYSSDN
jgi:hypothetical protein